MEYHSEQLSGAQQFGGEKLVAIHVFLFTVPSQSSPVRQVQSVSPVQSSYHTLNLAVFCVSRTTSDRVPRGSVVTGLLARHSSLSLSASSEREEKVRGIHDSGEGGWILGRPL